MGGTPTPPFDPSAMPDIAALLRKKLAPALLASSPDGAANSQDPLPPSRRPPPDASSLQGPRLIDRINDDPRQTQVPESGTEDLENQVAQPRKSLAEAMQQGTGDAATADLESRISPPDLSGGQPSDTDRMQQQYDTLGQRLDAPPPKHSLLKDMLGGALAGPQAGAAFQRRQQGEEFQQNQVRERQQSLGQQIEAQRRMEEQERAQTERERMTQQAQTEREKYQTDSQGRLFQQQNEMIDRRLAGQKPDSLEQQYDEAVKSGDQPGQNRLLNEMRAVGGAKQPPQRPSQTLMVGPDGKIIEARPGMSVQPGTVTAGQYGPEQAKASEKAATANATMSSFGRYQNSFQTLAPQLTEQDRRALEVLTSHQQVAHAFFAKEAAGVLDTLFGEPLTGYSEKAMNGIMTKDQFDALSPAGKKMLADYFNAVITNFANMKQIMGSVGRNELMLQAEIATIPLPYIDQQSANAAFSDKMDDLRSRNPGLASPQQSTPGAQLKDRMTGKILVEGKDF